MPNDTQPPSSIHATDEAIVKLLSPFVGEETAKQILDAATTVTVTNVHTRLADDITCIYDHLRHWDWDQIITDSLAEPFKPGHDRWMRVVYACRELMTALADTAEKVTNDG